MSVSDAKLTLSEFVNYHLKKFSSLDDATFKNIVAHLTGVADAAEVIDDVRSAVVPETLSATWEGSPVILPFA